MPGLSKLIFARRKVNLTLVLVLLGVVSIALSIRLVQPINDKSIGEIDVYYWALRTQEYLHRGWSGIGTSLWVTPVVMGNLHRLVGGTLYDLFLWTGVFISGIFPPIGVYLLTKEISSSRIAGIFGALSIAVNPIILYRSVFTVSETLAYVLIPWTLFFAVRLVKTKKLSMFFATGAGVIVAMQTHDSSKLLVLPAAISVVYFFWTTRKKKSTWVVFTLTVLVGGWLLVHDPSIIAGLRFFLLPSNSGNSAFGKYPPVTYNTYVAVGLGALSLFSIVGFFVWLIQGSRQRWVAIVLIAFILPVLYYQQIQPRISESTIVPFRLTPYLSFAAAPLFGVAVAGWLRAARAKRRLRVAVIFVAMVIIISQISLPNYSLAYVTGEAEQKSLLHLPVTQRDYLIVQTSMIGMTSLATNTNESNYYGDLTDRIFGAQSGQAVRQRLQAFMADYPTRPTGVLISKWKMTNRDPYYGWFDLLVNPNLNIAAWRASGLPIRYEDDNILIFDII